MLHYLKKYLVFIILIYSSQYILADTAINEIMYDPSGSDNNKEFIELYHSQWLNFSGYTAGDADSNDTLQLIYFYNSSYSLIVEEGFNYTEINASIYSVGAAIGNNLNNDEDAIAFYYPNGSLIDYLYYSSSWGGAGDNGYSLEKTNPIYENSQANWLESLYINGSPGRANSRYVNETEEAVIDYSKLSINEFLPDPEGDDGASMPYGEWVELYNSADYSIDMEGLMLYDDNDAHELYITSTNTINSTIINANSYLVVYKNSEGDFSLNNEGFEKVRLYDKENNLIEEISYSDSTEGSSYAKVNGIWQHTKPTPNENNANYSNVKDSYLNIENIYDLGSNDKAEFGQSIRIRLQVYKGDTAKDSIALWIEDDKNNKLSKQSKTNVYTRYTNYTLTLPIQIMPNCDESFEDNSYIIHAEGLDVSDTAGIYIEGITKDLCEEIEVEKNESKSKFEYELIDAPDTIKTGEDFSVKVRLANNDDEIHKVDIWSYVFRGNKCYSCIEERDENKKMITLPKKDSVEVKLKNKVDKAEPGDYKLKIALIKDGQKTIHDITAAVSVAEDLILTEEYCKEKLLSAAEETEGIEEVTEAPLQILNKDTVLESIKEPRTIYSSTNIKIKELIPVFIIATLTVFCSVLVWKR